MTQRRSFLLPWQVQSRLQSAIHSLLATLKIRTSTPPSAAARKGIQPVVDLKVNGGVRTEVAVGKPVTFTAAIETPPGTGPVVVADWDFDGTGEYPTVGQLNHKKLAKVTVTASHAYTRPGVYFAAIRATAQAMPET